jgi:hypothetical protein
VLEGPATGTVTIEVSSSESRDIAAAPPAANRLAAQIGYRVLVLAGIPPSVIARVALPRAGSVLMEKYSSELLNCARLHEEGFTLTYPLDVERMRSLWRSHSDADVLTPGSPGQAALMDILSRLETVLPQNPCPES